MVSMRPRPPIVDVRHRQKPDKPQRPITPHTPFMFNVTKMTPDAPEPSSLAKACLAAGACFMDALRWAGLVAPKPGPESPEPT